jgi:L,D-transpeptidase catalytic domain
VHIAPVGGPLPKGASFTATDGPVGLASFRFRPSRAGDYRLRFTASTDAASVTRLTYVVHVEAKVVHLRAFRLTDDRVARWAVVLRRVVARAQPKASSRAVTVLDTTTTDATQNLVLVLDRLETATHAVWYHVRLPILPNNSTGWVRAVYLGRLYTVHTHLYVDRTRLTATLERDGKPIFRTAVGVGRSYWPTPHGEFYIRDKLTGFGDAAYGPVAFGTSARSAVLTDWPVGGFVGVHGTDEPGILPGHVSHGCIRMRNDAILKLSRLMPVGTPLTIR